MTALESAAPHPAHDPAYARLRADALARLRAWTPPDATDEVQIDLREEMIRHLEAHPDAMARTGPPAHFTASVVVLDHDLTSVLLTHHRKARAWFQFGGHYEGGDVSVLAAAAREAREESGLEFLTVLPDIVHLDRHALIGDFGRCREHLDIRFAATAALDGEPAVSDESLDVRWWPLGSLPPGAREELAPLLAAAVSSVRRG